jgi:F0F1-type ATP synthase assembly protein I
MAEDHTTIVETGNRSSTAGWFIAAVLVVGLIVGVYFITRTSDGSAAKDNAIASAAKKVGDAAQKAGDAAQDAANNTSK